MDLILLDLKGTELQRLLTITKRDVAAASLLMSVVLALPCLLFVWG